MPKKERKRLQVVISEEQDALLTKTAYELSSPERLISKSEVVRLAIEKIAREMGGDIQLDDLRALLDDENVSEHGGKNASEGEDA
ncbi:transcriptional regulator [Deinococcus sp.]|uniref:transcriptional regulator n=1 Tax=Deinococcus sp. TaxID=47478 RepID=UPI00286D707A|nr:transcriptional regulator [Deinococcus sp.]